MMPSSGWPKPTRPTVPPVARLDPTIVLGGALAALVAGIEHAARLDQQQFDLPFGVRLVLDPFRHHEHFPGAQPHRPVAKIDPQYAVDHDEGLIGVLVIVPDEIPLQLHYFELVIVHLRDHLWLP